MSVLRIEYDNYLRFWEVPGAQWLLDECNCCLVVGWQDELYPIPHPPRKVRDELGQSKHLEQHFVLKPTLEVQMEDGNDI